MYEKNKKQFYESATNNILSKLDGMGLSKSDKNQAVYYVKLFREIFKYEEMRKWTFAALGGDLWDFGYDSVGFCRVASIAFSSVMGVKDWQLMCIDEDKWDAKSAHHYLKHIPSGKFFDITYDQFAIEGFEIPYHLGHPAILNLGPGDETLRFADALNIDILEELKKQSSGRK